MDEPLFGKMQSLESFLIQCFYSLKNLGLHFLSGILPSSFSQSISRQNKTLKNLNPYGKLLWKNANLGPFLNQSSIV